MTSRIRIAMVVGGLVMMAALLPPPARAQAAPDARWGPWLGCWGLVQQPARIDPRETSPAADAPPAVSSDARVCVERSGDGAVVRTLVDGAPVLEQTVVADGVARPIERDACRGTERAWWSSNGLRLFSEARLTCAGSTRTVSGMALIAADGRWIDVQSVQVGPADTVRVRHFEPDVARASVPNVSAANLTIDEVAEASTVVMTSTLEAAILESRSRFPLSARALVELSDAGVPGSVTDLMVAVTFPERFRIQRTQPDDRVALLDPYPYYGSWDWRLSGYDPYFYSPYYYSPFGYSYLDRYPVVVIGGAGGVGGGFVPGDDGRNSGPARVINGQGYTRVVSDSVAGSDSGFASPLGGGSVSRQGFSSGGSDGGSASSGASSAGDSGGGGGGSSSGDGGGGGRTAVPR